MSWDDVPTTKLRTRRNTLSNAAEILALEGDIATADQIRTHASRMHDEIESRTAAIETEIRDRTGR